MNEFEWRRQLRQLRQPTTPRRDLWRSIESALADQDAPRIESTPQAKQTSPQRWPVLAGMAACVLLAVVSVSWHEQPRPAASAQLDAANRPWNTADPRLEGATIELQAARRELQQALKQAPDSPALRRLLNRTEQQQADLRLRARQAS